MKMHDEEIDIDAELVGALVAEQFPQLSNLPISAV
jgi:aminoglycoside phosphotransferase (APT) family kinase protein